MVWYLGAFLHGPVRARPLGLPTTALCTNAPFANPRTGVSGPSRQGWVRPAIVAPPAFREFE